MSKKLQKLADGAKVGMENLKGFAKKGARFVLHNVPTGHPSIDFALHYGMMLDETDLSTVKDYDSSKTLGFPLGRLVEIFGETGSGKSSICYRVIGSAQKMGLSCMWFDAEQSFSDSLATINGVNLDELWLAERTSCAEEHLDNIVKAIESGIKVIVLDSIAGLVPRHRMENSSEEQTMALKARLLSEMIPKIGNKASEYGCLVIFINQIRVNMKITFGDNKKTPGGETVPFFTSIRLNVFKRNGAKEAIFIKDDSSKDGKRYIGHYSGLKIDKNRFGKPLVGPDGRKIILSVPIYFEPYFPNIAETAFEVGRQLKIISVRKGVFSWKEVRIEGQDEFLKHVKANVSELIVDIKEKIKDSNKEFILPIEIENYDPEISIAERVDVSSKDESVESDEINLEEEVFDATQIGSS
jgi:protein RecA